MTIKESILRIQQRKASATGGEPKNDAITERVRTFSSACIELGIEPNQFMNSYDDILPAHAVAYLKLCIIAAALNEGWEPKYSKDEKRYYPTFELREKYDKADSYLVGFFHLTANGFTASSPSDFISTLTAASPNGAYQISVSVARTFPDALAVKSAELAQHFGRQFFHIWKDYLITFQAAI